MTQSGFVIGVDGGGTKTLGEIADLNGSSRASHALGPTNPNVVGTEPSARTLTTLIRHLCVQASCHPGSLRGIALGLAGGGGEKIQQELQEKVKDGLHQNGVPDPPIQVVTDIRIALEGAFDGGPGIAVVAGTGSSIMYKTAQGEAELVGGWGRTLGDEGSGYFIGLEALKAVGRDYDGMAHAEALRDALGTRFGLNSRFRIIEAIYRQHFPIPSLAPLVFDLAARQDGVSCGILKRSATLLADQLAAALPRLHGDPVGIVLFGGLLEHDTPFKDIFIAHVTSRFPQARIQPPRFSAVHGAVMIALSLVREKRGV
jgi:N-acetylglucosamine kinase-like BadF-type ATPase